MRTPTQTRRLWKLVDLMKYDPDPENFDQRLLWDCNTPACLLGHAEAYWNVNYLEKCFFGLEDADFTYLFGTDFLTKDSPSIAASRVIDVICGE